MILAGDIGGTNTRLAAFEAGDGVSQLGDAQMFSSRNFVSFEAILAQFFAEEKPPVERACFGIAGPIRDGVCRTPNLPWIVDSRALAKQLQLEEVILINDLEANAHGISQLNEHDFRFLHHGHPDAQGNAALISAGTGLGEAGLHNEEGELHPFATEGGHVDFAPRTTIQMEMLSYFLESRDHVSYEHFLSGPGIVNIYHFLVEAGYGKESENVRDKMDSGNLAAVISTAAVNNESPICVKALELFVSIYGAEAGNLALKTLATGGVFLGGGIAPKIVDKLTEPMFLDAFFSKGRMSALLKEIPIKVIMNDKAALLGAASVALTGRRMRARPKREIA